MTKVMVEMIAIKVATANVIRAGITPKMSAKRAAAPPA